MEINASHYHFNSVLRKTRRRETIFPVLSFSRFLALRWPSRVHNSLLPPSFSPASFRFSGLYQGHGQDIRGNDSVAHPLR